MRHLILITMLASYTAHGEAKSIDATYRVVDGKTEQPVTKVEALRALLDNKRVVKCSEQELTEKATLRNKKVD